MPAGRALRSAFVCADTDRGAARCRLLSRAEPDMRPSRIQLVSKGRRVPFLSEPALSSADYPWAGYQFEESAGQNEPISRGTFLKTTLFLCTGGEGVAHRKHRGVWQQYGIRPGSVFIVRGGTEIQAAWASNPWPTMVMQLDNAKFQGIAPEEVRAIETLLTSAVTTQDERLAALMHIMREEVKEGCPSGRLFGESISLALLGYLASKYATPRPIEEAEAKLSPTQRRSLVDYIRANIASNIAVTDLAAHVNMSPSHFARVFKASFGVTPYRFVMQERIAGAKAMLASADVSASEAAMAFGFASQSHFVKVFRQFTGVTPKQFRSGF
jgi:AraC family transcriptional regulator